jgi:hypothetical protein
MLSRIRFFFTLLSLFALILTLFLWLHSRRRHDLWAWDCAKQYDRPVSTVRLAASANRFCFNYWFMQPTDPDDTLINRLEYTAQPPAIPTLQNPPIFSQDGFIFSRAGLVLAYHPRGSAYKNPYFGLIAPFWLPLILFSLLPAYSMYRVIRGRQLLKIGSTIFSTLTLISTTLAILFLLIWFRSFRYDDMLVREGFFSGNQAYFVSTGGITRLYFFDHPPRIDGIHWHRYSPDRGNMNLAVADDPNLRLAGFGYTHTTYTQSNFFSGKPTSRPVTILALPYYALFAIASILPITWLVLTTRVVISRRRRLKGLCPTCAYDMRATPELCPECGYTPTPKTPAPPPPSPIAS